MGRSTRPYRVFDLVAVFPFSVSIRDEEDGPTCNPSGPPETFGAGVDPNPLRLGGPYP